MKKRIALLLILVLFASLNAQAQTIALQTDPPLYIVRRTEDKFDYYYDLVDAEGNIVQERWASSVREQDGKLEVTRKGRIGYLGYDGKWIAEPQFDWVGGFHEGFALAMEKGLYGYIGEDYTWRIAPRFDYAKPFSDALAAAKESTLWGYVDSQGDYAIEPRFEEAESFENGRAVVREGKRFGVIDKTGAFLNTLEIDGIIFSQDGLIKVEKNGRHGLLDLQGNTVLEPVYECIYYFNDQCAVVAFEELDINGWEGLGVAGNSVVVNLQGETLWDEVFDDVRFGDDGTILAEKDGVKRTFAIENGVMREVQVVGSSLNLADYAPFEGQKNAAGALREDVGFDSAYALPRLDGATALFPVYAAYAQTIYPEDTRYTPYNRTNYRDTEYDEFTDSLLTCSKTDRAYERLIYGNTDVIFCAQPSDEELQMAKEAGVELELTPIGYEAFVFIVPQDSPVTGLTVKNIQDIYGGVVTDWAQLGVPELGKIIAYQRPENSGSQTALIKIMDGVELVEAPSYVVEGMETIVDNVEYRNLPGAIGYSFRYFVSGMMESDVRMLAIDGVEPTLENIRNGSYPFISTLYAVTRKGEANPNVQTLLSWLTGDTAQRLLESSGYVGLK